MTRSYTTLTDVTVAAVLRELDRSSRTAAAFEPATFALCRDSVSGLQQRADLCNEVQRYRQRY